MPSSNSYAQLGDCPQRFPLSLSQDDLSKQEDDGLDALGRQHHESVNDGGVAAALNKSINGRWPPGGGRDINDDGDDEGGPTSLHILDMS